MIFQGFLLCDGGHFGKWRSMQIAITFNFVIMCFHELHTPMVDFSYDDK